MTRAAAWVLAGLAAAEVASGSPPRQGPVAQSPSGAPASRAPGFDRIVEQAVAARAAGRLDAAVEHYRRALALEPRWIEGHWAVATVLFDLDRHAEAREHFRRVVAARREDGLAWMMTGLCDARLKDYDTALADLQQAHRFGISSPELRSLALFQTALLLNRAGNFEAAFDMLREFAGQGKDSPQVLVAFGLSLLRLRFLPDEVPHEKREMVQLAGRGGYHMARGRRTAVGRLALEELVSRFPSEPNVHYALGAYIAPEEPEAAVEEYRTELRAAADHYPSLIQIASLETRRGNAREAVPLVERAVALAPEVPAARLVLGRALLELGETERAIQELEKGASLAPHSAEVQFALARAYQRAGRDADAARAREEFLRLDRATREREATPESEGSREQAPRGASGDHGGP